MLIRKVGLDGILSFGEQQELDMQPLNVLIGPNGSGKSNFLDVVGLLKAAPTDIEAPLRKGGGVNEWVWKGQGDGAAHVVVMLNDPEAGELVYKLSLSANDNDSRLRIVGEDLVSAEYMSSSRRKHLYYSRVMITTADLRARRGGSSNARRDVNIELEPNQSIFTVLKDLKHYPEITSVGEQFGKMQLYREWTIGRSAELRLPQRTDLPNAYLEENGHNLGLVLNRLTRDPGVRRDMVNALRRLYEGISDVHVSVDFGTVRLELQEGDHSIPATRLSDGALRYLCLLAILCDPKPPPVVCLEEPELGLHPDILPGLADLMLKASERCQLIVTTHSDVLVDALTETPESVVVCEKGDEGTKLKRLDREDLADWIERCRLGELWTSGHIGGTRW